MGCGGTKAVTVVSPTDPIAVELPSLGPVDFKPVHSAVRWNKIAQVRLLLTSSEAVNCNDPGNGNRPIHIAAQNGHLDVIKLLVQYKAEINAKNGKGNTAIHMAIGYDYYDCAKILMNAGGDINLANDAGFPGYRGLEGDKSLGVAAFIAATTINDVLTAFTMCEEKISEIDKVTFVSTGLRLKKTFKDEWTPEIQDRFKNILSKIGNTI